MRRHLSIGITLACSLIVGCQHAATPAVDAGSVVLGEQKQVTVKEDGTFDPPLTQINEGDTIIFVGESGALRRTDAIVQTNFADLEAAKAAKDGCMTSTFPYTITHMLPNDDNEFTGPLRRGVSGIFALGPEAANNSFEGDPALTCDEIAIAAGAQPLGVGETWGVDKGPDDKSATQLCLKLNGKNKASDTTNSPYLLKSTWDNPDITGAVIRINWRDLYTSSVVGGTVVYAIDFTRLDTELENAATRGKVVALDLMAGVGIPPWLFDEYDPTITIDASKTGLTARSVLTIKTRDYGSGEGDLPTAMNCGYDQWDGSPADPAYKQALIDTLTALATHVRNNARWYQALSTLKVTGLNFLTGEMRLPNRCLDPKGINANGNKQTVCWCNTAIWAAPLGSIVDPAISNAGVTVKGAGYTTAIAQNFMNAIENTIYVELGKRKSFEYMLIQDGFPKVVDATHFDTDAKIVAPNAGYVDANGKPIAFDQQTIDALNNGQGAGFCQLNADGSPDVVSPCDDLHAGALFVPMNGALAGIPVDASGLNSCKLPLATTLVGGKLQGVITNALPSPTLDDYGGSSSGCPNKWAVLEGYEGQIIGYQNRNVVDTSDALSSSLWNITLNSNAVFLEVYEHTLWYAHQERLLGATALSTTAAGYADVVERQKSLAQWNDELHARRRTLAGFASADNRHMKDPFPDAYAIAFTKPLAKGAVETYYYVNPAARCAATKGFNSYGTIEITGK